MRISSKPPRVASPPATTPDHAPAPTVKLPLALSVGDRNYFEDRLYTGIRNLGYMTSGQTSEVVAIVIELLTSKDPQS